MSEKVVVELTFGSHLYGTNTPSSDIDLKAVVIPTAEQILLQKTKLVQNIKRPKSFGEKNLPGEIDVEIFSLQKYLDLLYQGQTVALDMLFVPDKYIIQTSPIWKNIQKNRQNLICKKSKSFVGYCMQQAKKYGIKGSRVDAVRKTLNFLLELAKDYEWSGDKLGSWENYIGSFVIDNIDNEFIQITTQDHPSGNKITFLEVCGRKMSYTASLKNSIEMMQRLLDEYGKRALMAEKNEGVDWKALSHAVRIAEEAIELLTTGHITFPRPNAECLKDIKLGKMNYKEVAEIIEDLFPKVEEASLNSKLSEEIDIKWIDNFIYDVYDEEVVTQHFKNLLQGRNK